MHDKPTFTRSTEAGTYQNYYMPERMKPWVVVDLRLTKCVFIMHDVIITWTTVNPATMFEPKALVAVLNPLLELSFVVEVC